MTGEPGTPQALGIIKPDEANEKPAEQPKETPFQCSIDGDMILTMRLDLKHAVVDIDKFYILRGFIDSQRDSALQLINKHRQQMAVERAKIQNAANGVGMANFLRGLRKH